MVVLKLHHGPRWYELHPVTVSNPLHAVVLVDGRSVRENNLHIQSHPHHLASLCLPLHAHATLATAPVGPELADGEDFRLTPSPLITIKEWIMVKNRFAGAERVAHPDGLGSCSTPRDEGGILAGPSLAPGLTPGKPESLPATFDGPFCGTLELFQSAISVPTAHSSFCTEQLLYSLILRRIGIINS